MFPGRPWFNRMFQITFLMTLSKAVLKSIKTSTVCRFFWYRSSTQTTATHRNHHSNAKTKMARPCTAYAPRSNHECNAGVRRRRIVETACRRKDTHLEKPCPERTMTASQATENEYEILGQKPVRQCRKRSWKAGSMERNRSRHQYGEQWIAMSAKTLQRQRQNKPPRENPHNFRF